MGGGVGGGGGGGGREEEDELPATHLLSMARAACSPSALLTSLPSSRSPLHPTTTFTHSPPAQRLHLASTCPTFVPVLELAPPPGQVGEGGALADVVGEEDSFGSVVVHAAHRSKPLLARCVPVVCSL